jgi:serine/threonine protein kinase/Tol biopolymer transport system component
MGTGPGDAQERSRLIGTSVSHYLLLEHLATGARGGAVYKARDLDLERLVALKLLPAGISARQEDRQRLAREAEAASALEHPNICPVYEVGEAPDGRLFIALAFLEGETVADKIARGPLKIEVAVDLAAQIASGLARAHERGIVHRGLKPSEVLVTPDGQARILDFGVAALDDRTRVAGDQTPAGLQAYRSPEQLRGDTADPRADIWALGAILYEMVTGRLPFPEGVFHHPGSAAAPEPMSTLRGGAPAALDRLDRIVARALARRPADRYARADDLRDDLRALGRETSTQVRRHDGAGFGAGSPAREVGPYRVGEMLGGGGMGIVYRAEDTRLGRTVALKFLPPELTRDPVAKARFLQEARTASALDHPNLCTVYDVGETDEHQLYLAMPCYDGETLRRKIERGPLPVSEAIDYALQTAKGLAKAHRQGIVHRDIKPANLMVTGDSGEGVVKILDFGIAKLAGEAGLTRTGASVGTPAYMAPEQMQGREVDGRADLWALGVVLYEMLAGHRPFLGDHEAALRQSILSDAPEPLPRVDVPPGLERVVRLLLAREPDERYPSADAAIADLRLLAGLSSTSMLAAEPPSPITRRALPLWGAGILVFAALAALGGYVLRSRESAGRAAPVQATFTRLTEQEGSEAFPSLSPDGNYFVYVKSLPGKTGNTGNIGNADIFLQRVGGGNPINLTPDTPWDDTQPAFSPDGRQIAFRSERPDNGGTTGGIFLMGATGESVRRLAGFGYNPAWSPDGMEVVVATESVANSPWLRSSLSHLFRLDVATGERRQVLEADAVQPSWSPGGKRIAYWSSVPGVATRVVWTVAAGGGEPVRVTSDSALNWNPVWSPDGRHLYYASDRGGSMNLWRVRIDEGSGRVLGEPEPVTTPAPWSSQLSLSRDGRRIVYATVDGRNQIEKIALDPRTLRPLSAPVPVSVETKAFRFLNLSPDGRSLVFDTSAPQEDLFVVGADGRGLRRLTDDPAKDRIPRWSADGSRILFYSNRGGHFDLWSVHADGSGLEPLTRTIGPPLINPIGSPDGRLVTCGVGTSNQAALVDLSLPLAKRVPRLLPPPGKAGETFTAGAWSPDSRWLAGRLLDAKGSTLPGIHLYSLDSGRYERLSDAGLAVAWLQDDRTLIARGDSDEESDGLVLAFDRIDRRFWPLMQAPPGSTYAVVSPSRDGSAIYTLRSTGEGDIWMLDLR